MVEKPRRQSEEVLKMEEDRTLVHVAKLACEKCGQEINAPLWIRPEHRITEDVSKEHTEQSKEAHRDECKGRMGIARNRTAVRDAAPSSAAPIPSGEAAWVRDVRLELES